MSENLVYLGYSLAWRFISFLPEGVVYRWAYKAADSLTKKSGKGVTRLRSNYARMRPELSDLELEVLVREGMRSYVRYWIDTFRFPRWSRERILSTVTIENEHILRDALSSGKGAVVSLPHAGNWDHAGAYFCAKGIPLVTVAERLKPEKLFLKFLAYRQSMGMEVLPLDGRVLGTLAQRLRQGALVALVADRDLSRSGIDVEFFNGTARMPAGPALLALKTQAPLITAFVSYTENGIHIDFKNVVLPSAGEEDAKVREIVQMTAKHFEKGISQNPQDWHMLQRIWVDGDFKERG